MEYTDQHVFQYMSAVLVSLLGDVCLDGELSLVLDEAAAQRPEVIGGAETWAIAAALATAVHTAYPTDTHSLTGTGTQGQQQVLVVAVVHRKARGALIHAQPVVLACVAVCRPDLLRNVFVDRSDACLI